MKIIILWILCFCLTFAFDWNIQFTKDMSSRFPHLNWSTTYYCNNTGISCDQGNNIQAVILPYQHLSGYLPGSIAELTSLKYLILNNNNINGCIPYFSEPLISCDIGNNKFDCFSCAEFQYPCNISIHCPEPIPSHSDLVPVTQSFFSAAITFFVFGSICLLCTAFIFGLSIYFGNKPPGTEKAYRSDNPRIMLQDAIMDLTVTPEKMNKSVSELKRKKLWLPNEKQALAGTEMVTYVLQPTRIADYNDPGSFHFHLVESRFYRLSRTANNSASKYNVTKVDYIINPPIIRNFEAKHREFIQKYGLPKSRPIFAWHGTKQGNIDSILKNNFKIDQVGASTDKGWYGAGIYLTEFPDISLNYSQGEKLILCEILLGSSFKCQKIQTGRPPEPGYDSHCSPEGYEIVIFDPNQIIPRYLVYLEKNSKSNPLKIYQQYEVTWTDIIEEEKNKQPETTDGTQYTSIQDVVEKDDKNLIPFSDLI